MDEGLTTIIAFLETVHPYDGLPQDELARVAGSFSRREYAAGDEVYHAGEPLRGLFLVKRGAVEVLDPSGAIVSLAGSAQQFWRARVDAQRAGGDDGAGDAGFGSVDAAGG